MKFIKTKNYCNCFNKLKNSTQKQIIKQEDILKSTKGKGKPLYKNILFERKIEGFRIFYILKKKEELLIVMISISRKKKQQNEVDKIKELLNLKFN